VRRDGERVRAVVHWCGGDSPAGDTKSGRSDRTEQSEIESESGESDEIRALFLFFFLRTHVCFINFFLKKKIYIYIYI
jgi:hypothetical protein